MMGKLGPLLVLTVVIAAAIHGAEGCKCLENKPKDIACNADFVAKMTVVNCEISGDKEICTLTPRYASNVYKSNTAFNNLLQSGHNMIKADTMYQTSCRVNMEKNRLYLITGTLENGKKIVTLNPCYTKIWSELSCEEKDGFSSNYYKECS